MKEIDSAIIEDILRKNMKCLRIYGAFAGVLTEPFPCTNLVHYLYSFALSRASQWIQKAGRRNVEVKELQRLT